jgi:holin-like protein
MPRTPRVIHRSLPLQFGILFACWLAGELVVRLAHLPIPGGIAGLAIVLALLASRRLSAVSLRRGSQRLLADMLLFFVPAVLTVLRHKELLGLMGLKILFVILAGTVTVMLTTAFVVDCAYRWRTQA